MTMETDLLIIGSGIAGLTTALTASKKGIKVTVITNGPEIYESNTYYAQGGIIYKGKGDSAELLKKDLQNAGAGLCNPKAIDTLASMGPKCVENILIKELDVDFDRTSDGDYHITEEAAHSLPRIIHSRDLTGRSIEISLLRKIKKIKNITLKNQMTAIDLLTFSHHSKNPLDIYRQPECFGAYVFDQKAEKVVPFFAKETVLATGGVGALFLHTTNPKYARGDGIAMAKRAGAQILNMEYIQFHPTALYHRDGERFLISESMRGEGAELINKQGKPFMEKYHRLGTLAPRDIVARAIHEEMIKDDSECVYLDITSKKPEWIKERFPNIYEKCLSYNIDITKDPIPVVPAAHYLCGGIFVDSKGRTSIKRLRAVGEVSCTGIHGANRLASSSLLEGLVWGYLAGKDIANIIVSKKEKFEFPKVEGWKYEKEAIDPALIAQDWLTIKHTMWNYVGLVRSSKRLARAERIFSELTNEIEEFYRYSVLSDDLIGLRNGIQAAQVILNAARSNRKSRGCHYRTD
ncbi:MAG: L-aspartate oxidase [Candidatus Schekmanbacteria bacterium]|nr:MAG: L-aspartate oxidase [Candidatus Schekmanbacteria bacterium]